MKAASSMWERIRGRAVLLSVGPGGVGKTTSAASLALAVAERGRSVLVATVDPSRRLAQALGLGGDQAAGAGRVVPVLGRTAGGGRLDAVLVDPAAIYDTIVREHARSPEAGRAILENPIYRATAEHLAGALEYAAMAAVQMLHARRSHDLIVLDTPPTASAIEFLRAPARVREIVENTVARLLARGGRLGARVSGLAGGSVLRAFGAVASGRFVADIGRFLGDFGAILSEFHRRGGEFEALLSSGETGVVVTTGIQEFSLRETTMLLRTLRDRRLAIDAIVQNRVEPELPPLADEDLGALLRGLPQEQAERARVRIREIHDQLRAMGQRGAEVRAEISRRFPGLPIGQVPRREPPPVTLDALREIGAGLLGPA